MKRQYTVLLIEDDSSVRELLREVLTNGGFITHEAENGEEGIAALANHDLSIDIILSDLRMPKQSGVKVAEFNYEHKFLPFVVYTAVADSELALKLLPLGVQDYLIKPVKGTTLIGVLNNALNRRLLQSFIGIDENPYAGNVGEITIRARREELARILNWVEGQILTVISEENNRNQFLTYVGELLQNAYEHGCLKIGEEMKTHLLNANEFKDYLLRAEKTCLGNIQVSISCLRSQISINITDSGFGFDYEKYLGMTEDIIMDRLKLPNGRGILMARTYFDSVHYTKGGASVTVTKSLPL